MRILRRHLDPGRDLAQHSADGNHLFAARTKNCRHQLRIATGLREQASAARQAEDAAKLILDFIGKAQASLGSSKSLADLSGEGTQVLTFLSHMNQIGQTGATPRHPKGLATCCHGEEPHVVGWRFINERRAVNLDPSCGWARGKTDVLYVADAFAVMQKLNALLK